MDQLFGKASSPLQPRLTGLVAQSVMETPEGRRRYRERMAVLITNVFKVELLSRRVEQLVAQIQPALGDKAARDLVRQAAILKERIAKRALDLNKQLQQPELAPAKFENGVAALSGWQRVDEPDGGKMEQAKTPDGRPALYINAGPVTAASWRTKILLDTGQYRFEATVSTAGVKPLNFGKNKGAGLRIIGVQPSRPYDLQGDSARKKLGIDFEVGSSSKEVELICELRASKGEVWFEVNSLRLVKVTGL
jgi:hypothetical protein